MVDIMIERWVDIHGRGHLRTVAAEVTVVAVVIVLILDLAVAVAL